MHDIGVQGTYRFGPFHLDARERRLSRGSDQIPLHLKVFDTLLVLVENAGRLVTKQELLDTVWPGTAVEENNLNHNVSMLRKALGERATGQQYIETVPRVGYRFVAAVEAAASRAGSSDGSATKARQELRCCTTSDGVRLAYASVGNGPPLVKASNWLTHLDFEWGSPIWRHWYTALSRHHRLVRYDERGNGLSQRDVPVVNFDTWVRDLETVVDAAGLDRFPLLGISRGGPIAIAYAVKHPERVTQLVLYGAFAVGVLHVGTPEQLEARRAFESLVRLGWGLSNPAFCKTFTCRFIPEAKPEHERWLDELHACRRRRKTRRLMECDGAIDVRPLLSQLKVPTLVIHCDRDQVIPPNEVACWRRIPGARTCRCGRQSDARGEPAWSLFLEELGLF